MPRALLELYADALKELQAEEIMLGFLTSDMPHLSEGERKKHRRTLGRYLTTADDAPKIDHTTEAGHATAAGLGIKIDIPTPAIESPKEAEEHTGDA